MNKQLFQSIFAQQMGYVFKYLGVVPEGESATHYITEQFATAAGTNLVSTVVSELPHFGHIYVIYYHSDTNNISSTDFELIMDLVPDLIPEPQIVPETPAEEEQ
jgi:glutathionyl-hydroquinone reductase